MPEISLISYLVTNLHSSEFKFEYSLGFSLKITLKALRTPLNILLMNIIDLPYAPMIIGILNGPKPFLSEISNFGKSSKYKLLKQFSRVEFSMRSGDSDKHRAAPLVRISTSISLPKS